MLVQPTTALIIVSNRGASAPDRGARASSTLQRRDREKGRLWVDRHLRDWKAGFERSGRDLDAPVKPFERTRSD
jgi:hypothetical protein